MKKVFSSDNIFIVHNVKNIIAEQDIDIFMKNEFIQGAAGELAPLDTWPEIWVVNDDDYARAVQAVDSIETNNKTKWICNHCLEENEGSFEICWQCQHEKE